ncbi:MAG TPA: PAS domain S-box protein, partial [Xanthomonadales bacterium]|nr:PAS domain S-box protein [Xanthomonadales bacterium]
MPNWIQATWLAITCIAAILGVFHLLVWTRQRDQIQHAIVAAMSFAVAFAAILGMQEFTASSVADYAESLRWSHTMGSIVAMLVVAYVQYTAPGRLWLGWAVCLLRIPAEIANRTTGVSVSFLRIDELRPILTWGDTSFMSPVGQANPWFALTQLGNLLLLVYLIDVLVKLARQPRSNQRRRNLQSIGALLLLLVFSAGAMVLVVAFQAPVPASLSLAFLGFALVMNHHVVGDLMRAAELARALQLSNSELERFGGAMHLADRAIGLGLWRWEAATRQVWLSDRSARLLGFEREGSYDQELILAVIEAEDLARMRAPDPADGVLSAEFSDEIRIVRTTDGQRRWLAVHARRVLDPMTGKLVQVHGVVIDLTDQRAIGEVFRLVFEATPNAMLLTSSQGNIALANLSAAELTGYSVSELPGMNIDALVPANLRAGHAALRSDYVAGATRRQMQLMREARLQRRDGSNRVVEVMLHPTQVDSQPMVIVAIQDISTRLSREREHAMQRAALAHVARVGMLAELSGSLAHEINQPLAAILSNAQA